MFDTYCRLCARIHSNLIQIHEELQSKLIVHLKLKIGEDNLPKNICLECINRLNDFDEFIKQVQRAQEIFQKMIEEKILNFNVKLEDIDAKFFEIPTDIKNSSEYDDINEDIPIPEKNQIKEEKNRKMKKIKSSIKNCEKKIKADKKFAKLKRIKKIQSINLNRIFKDKWDSYQWICNICKTQMSSVLHLKAHYANNHPDSSIRYVCMECLKSIEKYSTFSKHVRCHWNACKYTCDKCGKFFSSQTRLRDHYIRHTNERKYMCSHCGKYYKTQNSLKTHALLHDEHVKRTFKCDMCDREFGSSSHLFTHKRKHNDENKKQVCEKCGKKFLYAVQLKQHLTTTHSDLQPYACNLCPRRFKTNSHLKRHAAVHSILKPYECDICLKRFRNKSDVNRHKIIHSNVFPWECEFCKKCFRTNSKLKLHLRQHTGERPYRCDPCNHDFIHWANYNKHMKAKHKKDMTSLATKIIQQQRREQTIQFKNENNDLNHILINNSNLSNNIILNHLEN